MAQETLQLAKYAAALRYDELPAPVIQRAKDTIADTIAAIAFGAHLPWSRIVVDYARQRGAGFVWNQNGGHSFWLGRGGHVSKVANGSTLGRLPHVTARGPSAWILYSPDESSPAKPNPYPGVTTMMPMSGAILKGLSTRLAWYTLPGATRYRVQIARDRSFNSQVVDQSVDAPRIHGFTIAGLAANLSDPGRYFWRVQAVFRGR